MQKRFLSAALLIILFFNNFSSGLASDDGNGRVTGVVIVTIKKAMELFGFGRDGDIINVTKEGISLEDLGINPSTVGNNLQEVACEQNGKSKICDELFKRLPKLKKLVASGKIKKIVIRFTKNGVLSLLLYFFVNVDELLAGAIDGRKPPQVEVPPPIDKELDKVLLETTNGRRRNIQKPQKNSFLNKKFLLAQFLDKLPPEIEKALENYLQELIERKLIEEAGIGRGIWEIIKGIGAVIIPYRLYTVMTDPPPDVVIDSFVRLVVNYCLSKDTMVLLGGSKVITVRAFAKYLLSIEKNHTLKGLVKIFAALDPNCIEEVFYIGGPFGRQFREFSDALEKKFGLNGASLETIVFWLQKELKKYYEELEKKMEEGQEETERRHLEEIEARKEEQERIDKLMEKYNYEAPRSTFPN